MALRVLLADESVTIKKVMQISLQDFAVEVRSVQIGLDVMQVAQTYKPDIIFADILLQKKNGYEVSQELKKSPATKSIPIVLMWSGFMEIDTAKMKSSHADDQLEKPFDADTLRALITKHVPKTKGQDLAKFLDFPDTPKIDMTQTKTMARQNLNTRDEVTQDFSIERTPTVTPEKTKSKVAEVVPNNESSWNMDSFEELSDFSGHAEPDEFQQVPLKAMKGKKAPVEEDDEETNDLDLSKFSLAAEDEWVQKDISAFRVDLPEDDEEPIALEFDVPEDDLEDVINTQTKPFKSPAGNRAAAEPTMVSGKTSKNSPEPVVRQLSQSEIEKIVREQSQEIIEKVVKKLVPDIASQLIKDEIRRLLDEAP